MSRCRQCNIEILDETERCPLCNAVLEPTIEVENMYPDIRPRTKKFVFISRLYLFLAVVIEMILVNVCILTEVESIVYIIGGLVMLYGYLVIKYAIIGKSGYKAKLLVLTIAAVCIFVAVDFTVGYRGWSVNYVLPTAIMVVDAGIVYLIITNRKNWQSYIMMEIFMVLCSVAAVILCMVGIVTDPIVSVVAMNASAALFLGTMILGGRRARVELKRRFHI